MRFIPGFLALLVLLAGCRSSDSPDPVRTQVPSGKVGGLAHLPSSTATDDDSSPSTNQVDSLPTILPSIGRIYSVHDVSHFVVIDYTLGGMPPPHSLLSVYRNGEKVGTVRLSGGARYGFVAADIEDGFLQVDDEVRLR